MGNMRFKVGDRVRIKSIDWYNENKNKRGFICFDRANFIPEMSRYCGEILTINRVVEEFEQYLVSECAFSWIDEMIEGLAEEENKPKFKVGDEVRIKGTDIGGTIESVIRGQLIVNSKGSKIPAWPEDVVLMKSVEEESANYSKVIDNGMSNPIIAKTSSATIDTDKGFYSYSDSDDNLEMEWNLPEGYQFVNENGNVINATKIVLEKKHNDKLKLESTKTVREYWSEYARIYIEIYDDEPNECVLTHLYTLEDHRQKGYGRQALIEAESIAKELGCHTTYLKVETDSWMHQWYLRMGYKWYKNVNKEYTWLSKNLTGMEKKKKEYPKTYEECCEVLGYEDIATHCIFHTEADERLFDTLYSLKVCRDAYWKIAGEEMGLGKPWEPDWTIESSKYIVLFKEAKIEKHITCKYSRVFAFPTEEMRDAFKENFKELIESVKELL